jgi:intergrase/recombinase
MEKINVKALSEDTRRAILQRVKDKLGFSKAIEVLDISKGSMHNYLQGIRKIPDEVILKALQHIEEEEFREIAGSVERLKAIGILSQDGTIDYPTALQILALATRDEYLKQAILRFAVEHFREDLKKMLGILPANIVLTWENGFENFLKEYKKRKKVRTQETLEYYKKLFKEYLEGKSLSRELIDYVINHENSWLRNVFRHYIRYLYFIRKISPETYGWIMEVVPSRSYKLDPRPYPISIEKVAKTLKHLKESNELYYLVYRLMLEGGLRLSHALALIKSFNPKELVEVSGIDLVTPRLVIFQDRGFCRYYLGIREVAKPCDWAYFSLETLELLKKNLGFKVSRWGLTRYVTKYKLLAPKYMRKVAWRLMIQVIPREVARFIQSRFGELRVSESRYEDLLSEADECYPRYLEYLRSQFSV